MVVSKPKINELISKYNYSKRSKKFDKNGYIVIHWVGAVSSAKSNAQYFYGGDRQASAHYFVDDSSIWKSVKTDNHAAWHCGGGLQGSKGHALYSICKNDNSIGIEMCCKKDSKGNLYISEETIARTGKLVKWLMYHYKVPASHVIRHFDVTGKACPGTATTDAKWKALKNKLVK